MANVRAQLNGIRLAPRKVRAIVQLLRNKNVVDVLDQLEHTIRRPAPAIRKLILSATANAENNFHMVRENLFIKRMFVDEGIKLVRYMPRAQGRATEIQKKTSRITIVLDERVPGLKKTPAQRRAEEKTKETEAKPTPSAKTEKPVVEKEVGKKKGFFGFGKKIFQRKAI